MGNLVQEFPEILKKIHFLMDFNKLIIKQTNIISFLLCEKTLVSYYKKRGWLKIKKEDINLGNIPIKSNVMIYNVKANL